MARPRTTLCDETNSQCRGSRLVDVSLHAHGALATAVAEKSAQTTKSSRTIHATSAHLPMCLRSLRGHERLEVSFKPLSNSTAQLS